MTKVINTVVRIYILNNGAQMSLRLRRGTDVQRQAVTFPEGELVYTNHTKKVFVGDGSSILV